MAERQPGVPARNGGRTGIGREVHTTMEGSLGLKLLEEKKAPEFKESVGTLVRLLAESSAGRASRRPY